MQRTELQKVEQALDFLVVRLARGKIGNANVERDVPDQVHEFEVEANLVLVGRQVLLQLWGLFIEGCVDPVDTPIFVDELRRGLLANPGHARKVVGLVAAHRCVRDVVDRLHAGAFENASLVVEGVIGNAALVVEHLHVGVFDQLVAIPVAGHDDDLL